MKQTKGIDIEVALRNIESSMRFEGFDFSEETCAACREILESGERAGEVAGRYVRLTKGRKQDGNNKAVL